MHNKTICLFALLSGVTLLATPARAQRWGREPTPDAGACFYEYPNFGGRYFCARAGEDLPFIPEGMNDRISSIRVFGGAQVVVNSRDRFDGAEGWFDYSAPNLRFDGWDDRISSLRVGRRPYRERWDPRFFEERPRDVYEGRDRSRGEEPPRDRPRDEGERGDRGVGPAGNIGPANVDAIVRRAYQDLLHREPDAGGLQQYKDRMLKDGWSEDQVRQSIMRSPEYHAKNR
jgi:hypothetical protein